MLSQSHFHKDSFILGRKDRKKMSNPFDLNRFFKAPLIKIDKNVRPPNLIQREFDECQKEINSIIDKLGRASAKAQLLNAPVTSSSRLASSDHFMYLIKDSEGNGGYGLAIGFLKIGFKKLYVYDEKGEMHEREPLCVLDFYVSEPHQRQGYGKRLYDYMLMTENVQPAQMAIDRPSLKLSSFLKKHYDLSHSIPQTNNFVIFEGFFGHKSEGKNDRRQPSFGGPSPYSCKKHYDADRYCKSAAVCRRATEPMYSKPQHENILPNVVESLSIKPLPSEEEGDSVSLIPPAGPRRSPDTTCQVGVSYLPNIKEPHPPEQANIPTNHIIDPCDRQAFTTTTQKEIATRQGSATRQFTTPFVTTYNRHLGSIGWPQPNEAYRKRTPNNQVSSKAPFVPTPPLQNIETLNNATNDRRTTMRFYADKYSNGGGWDKKTTAYVGPLTKQLPAVDNIYYQPIQPKTNLHPSNSSWTLVNNTHTYASLLNRGYAHTRLW